MTIIIGKLRKPIAGSSSHPGIKKPFLLAISLMVIFLSSCQSFEAAAIQASGQASSTPTQRVTRAQAPTQRVTRAQAPTFTPIHIPTFRLTDTPGPTQQTSENGRVTLMAVGDIMLGRTIGDLITTLGPEAPFIDTAPTLSSADITVGNLECPISDRGHAEEKTYAFRAPLAAAESLSFAGFDVVSLANNHTLDYGPLALEDTLKLLAGHQIAPVGAGMNAAQAYSPVFLEVNGLEIAFLAYADVPAADYDYLAWEAGQNKAGIAWAHLEQIRQGVSEAKKQADIVVVLLHNGYEIVQRVSGDQQEAAKLAIDSGASLVIGHHPHVLQRIETYNEGLIAYSMGNFVFDNFLFPPNYSAILKVELSEQGIETYELIDVIVQLNGVPQIMPYDLEN